MGNRVKQNELNGNIGAKAASVVDRWRALQAQTVKGGLTWSDAPAEELRDAIAAVTADGAAILLSKTSDGGALVIRVIAGDVSTPFYPASSSALNEVLGAMVDVVNNA